MTFCRFSASISFGARSSSLPCSISLGISSSCLSIVPVPSWYRLVQLPDGIYLIAFSGVLEACARLVRFLISEMWIGIDVE